MLLSYFPELRYWKRVRKFCNLCKEHHRFTHTITTTTKKKLVAYTQLFVNRITFLLGVTPLSSDLELKQGLEQSEGDEKPAYNIYHFQSNNFFYIACTYNSGTNSKIRMKY